MITISTSTTPRLGDTAEHTKTIPASELKAGDVLIEAGQRWRVDIAATNPRRVLPPNWTYPGYKPSDPRDVDMLVDVDATGLGFRVPCTRFSSYTLATILTIEAPFKDAIAPGAP